MSNDKPWWNLTITVTPDEGHRIITALDKDLATNATYENGAVLIKLGRNLDLIDYWEELLVRRYGHPVQRHPLNRP